MAERMACDNGPQKERADRRSDPTVVRSSRQSHSSQETRLTVAVLVSRLVLYFLQMFHTVRDFTCAVAERLDSLAAGVGVVRWVYREPGSGARR